MMLFFFTGLALLAAMAADAAQAPCESFSYQVEMLQADIESTHCVTDQDLGDVCDTVARDAIVTCMEEDSVDARDDCMEDYFAAENIDHDGHVLSGQEVLDCCKNRKYTEFYKLFEEAHLTVCPAENAAGARRKRSTYYPQHYDQHYGLNTIWFQYHLCKDQGINCWFFTQGWNQGDFGSYYLYDEVLDEDVFDGDLDFATLLLLGSLGGGHGGSRYRRGADDDAGSSGCGDNCVVCEDGKCQDRDPRLFSWFQAMTTPAPAVPATPAPPDVASITELLLKQFEYREDDAAAKEKWVAAAKEELIAAVNKEWDAAMKEVSLNATAMKEVSLNATAMKVSLDAAAMKGVSLDAAVKKVLSLAAAAKKGVAVAAAKKGVALAAGVSKKVKSFFETMAGGAAGMVGFN